MKRALLLLVGAMRLDRCRSWRGNRDLGPVATGTTDVREAYGSPRPSPWAASAILSMACSRSTVPVRSMPRRSPLYL